MTSSSWWYSTSPPQLGQIRMSSSSLSTGTPLSLLVFAADHREQTGGHLLENPWILRLHVQPEQRLGVRRPDVEPPFVELDRQAVGPVHPAVREGRRHPFDGGLLVLNLRVDLPGR